jgi:hypothetical protein
MSLIGWPSARLAAEIEHRREEETGGGEDRATSWRWWPVRDLRPNTACNKVLGAKF